MRRALQFFSVSSKDKDQKIKLSLPLRNEIPNSPRHGAAGGALSGRAPAINLHPTTLAANILTAGLFEGRGIHGNRIKSWKSRVPELNRRLKSCFKQSTPHTVFFCVKFNIAFLLTGDFHD